MITGENDVTEALNGIALGGNDEEQKEDNRDGGTIEAL